MSKLQENIVNGEAYSLLPTSGDSITPTHPPRRKIRKIHRFVIPVTLFLCIATFVLGLALGFALGPHDIKVYVSGARVIEFELVDNYTIQCKVEMVIGFGNPNKRASIHYKHFCATGYFNGNRFGSVIVPKFHQRHESVQTVYKVFEGKVRMPRNRGSEEFYKGKEDGFVDLEVVGHAWIKYKIGFFNSRKSRVLINCGLNKVALASNETHGIKNGGFKGTRCGVDFLK